MMGSFVTRALVLVLGYAYPAYECFKAVELNKPEVEQLIFWCQYWILVAALTVFERVGESFISWVPMYNEAKLASFVYLWYPKTKGTTYVYETFFRPYVAKHENEIDRNLLELRTRAGDIVALYWQKTASYGQTRLFEVLQYIASQSPSQSSRSHPVQQCQQPRQIRRMASTTAARQQTVSQEHQQQTCAPSNPTKRQLQEPAPLVAQPPASPALTSLPSSEVTALPTPAGDGEAMQVEVANAASKEDTNPPSQETPMEEAIRMTRGRLRKRAAAAGPSIR
ncbi:putative HVA22-like protein g isoform X9 [Phoenix dactylifera]|uniref:HVA22-like protein n=1 Tax=Phoenix dactylifera TaxID=42345 RepID=A0A8B7BTS1_PHODC|nr:putative HVA22-like protein g isoform X9 [Phoenix dactylifera]XP_008785133.2 putative HVA22-like protein g isoform X9 [Phoenix dactylifera]XP_008785138.2 putative HVA22-like protein g isoform X9 [Phoenix dactylifera]XP_038978143.1 putative HVA22-like protein g isoform X9 [Phoenix dactylifera]XP_038978144.1 putative HVA22-like protein g isoform X9 [Phoenix dactylifera]